MSVDVGNIVHYHLGSSCQPFLILVDDPYNTNRSGLSFSEGILGALVSTQRNGVAYSNAESNPAYATGTWHRNYECNH